MKLHDVMTLKYLKVMRVPGGWLYRYDGPSQSTVFVPFDNEFQQRENEPN